MRVTINWKARPQSPGVLVRDILQSVKSPRRACAPGVGAHNVRASCKGISTAALFLEYKSKDTQPGQIWK